MTLTVLVVLVTVVCFYGLWAMKFYTVSGLSMFPFFQDGERVLIVRGLPGRLYRRGHVVVLRIDTAQEGHQVFMKRIVGLEGDIICNGYRITGSCRSGTPDSLIVPSGYCYVRSDADGGVDSRLWGCIKLRAVQGVVIEGQAGN